MIFKRRFSKVIIKTIIPALLVGLSFSAFSKEGMWLPPTLKFREADMKALGLQIPVDKLYNEAGTGLNNAVVLFGTGCTAELISSKGLLLTNHHCGYGTVQGLSSRDKDYFANGFWAMNNGEEIPAPGLTVTFIRKMENVSDIILNGIPDTLNEIARNKVISQRIATLERGYRYTTKMDATIKPFFNGNQYWISITETFRDIRLVGFPPNGIGQFGGDTDNWIFPRHTGDFSLFRIYAGADNNPAAYNKNNKPYATNNFFNINISGYKEGDFTMVYGFPGTTQEYISSYQLNQVYKIIDPIRIDVRTQRLNALTKAMEADRNVFLKYTSNRARVANGWKKWQGEIRGLKINDVPFIKEAYQNGFNTWAARDFTMPWADNLLPELLAITSFADTAIKREEYIREAVLGIELISQGAVLDKMRNVLRSALSEAKKKDSVQKLNAGLAGFYKNYDAQTDKQIFTALMPVYFKNNPQFIPENYRTMYRDYGNDFNRWGDDVYRVSMLADAGKMNAFATNVSSADLIRIESDPAWQLYKGITNLRNQFVTPVINNYNADLAYNNRLYMRAQMRLQQGIAESMMPAPPDAMTHPEAYANPDSVVLSAPKITAIPDKNAIPTRIVTNQDLYPDANLTLRLTYGEIKGIDPEGDAGYSFQTNLEEAIAKNNPNVEEFTVPKKLLELYAKKDYGRWGIKKSNAPNETTVPLAFIASNHTSGGNSGSPVLNAKGELIGTNFDRIWEGTMSDLYFDPRLCRNISLDVRYTLFIIEKFGGAGWLLDEMKLVK